MTGSVGVGKRHRHRPKASRRPATAAVVGSPKNPFQSSTQRREWRRFFPPTDMPLRPGSDAIDRLRLASILDGVSYLILVGVAMPMKYLADMPLAVRVAGSLHGFLFLALCACLLEVLVRRRLSFGWCSIVLACALFPVAPLLLDRKLREKGGEAS
ncbi:MAG: hypothetical protein B9S36_03540 [Verrucomicrobiia bacterium Tous-C2TDCM]|nr:MAG: hypothetical protein B9S36_03540 [Verrucomicrobiae bacterium Tous-C2TDCM]